LNPRPAKRRVPHTDQEDARTVADVSHRPCEGRWLFPAGFSCQQLKPAGWLKPATAAAGSARRHVALRRGAGDSRVLRPLSVATRPQKPPLADMQRKMCCARTGGSSPALWFLAMLALFQISSAAATDCMTVDCVAAIAPSAPVAQLARRASTTDTDSDLISKMSYDRSPSRHPQSKL